MGTLIHRILFKHSSPPSGAVWQPSDLGANLFALYDSELGITEIASEVDGWADQSGNSRDLGTTSAVTRPAYTAGYLNGLHGVVFDGSNDQMFHDLSPALSQPLTLGLLYKWEAPTVNDHIFDGRADVAKRLRWFASSGDTTHEISSTAGPGFTGSAIDTDAHYATVLWNGASSYLRIDGVEDATGDVGSTTLAAIRFGSNVTGSAGTYANVGIVYAILADKALSAQELSDMENFLKTKGGL